MRPRRRHPYAEVAARHREAREARAAETPVETERVFTVPRRQELLGHLAAGMRLGPACYVIGIRRHIVEGYISENPGYALAVAEAEANAVDHVEEALYQAAISGSVPASKLWLTINGRVPGRGGGRRTSAPASAAPADYDPELDAAMSDLDL